MLAHLAILLSGDVTSSDIPCSDVSKMYTSATCCDPETIDIPVSRDTPPFVSRSILSTYEPTTDAWFRFRDDSGSVKVGIRTAVDGFMRDASSVVTTDIDAQTLPSLAIPGNTASLPILSHKVNALTPLRITTSSKVFGLFGNFDEEYEIQTTDGSSGYTEGFVTPNVFQKSTSAICGAETQLMAPSAFTKNDLFGGFRAGNRSLMDWEIELAVVIGKELKDADVNAAEDAVYGYVVASDISERGLQLNYGSQPEQGKSWPCFSTLAPYLVPKKEVYNGTFIQNDNVRQQFDMRRFLIGPAQAASYISKRTSLQPGDIILMGTFNDHIGAYADIWLQPGDDISLGIQTLGSFTQKIIPYDAALCAVTPGDVAPSARLLPFEPSQIYMTGGKSLKTMHTDTAEGIGFTVIAAAAASPFAVNVVSPAIKHVANISVQDDDSPFKSYMQRFLGTNYTEGTSLMDVEPALLIVIGAHGCNVDSSEAQSMIHGYLPGAVFVERGFEYAYNTAKIIQEGYSADTFFKMGDTVLASSDFSFSDLSISVEVDGEVRDTYAATDLYYQTPEDAVQYMSKMVKLQPGDVIAMLPFVSHSSHNLLAQGNTVTLQMSGFSTFSTTLN